jgi:hypothetical protein
VWYILSMTSFERTKQPIAVFEHAGRIAFSMQILKVNNPYPKTDANGVPEPANLAWDRGYDAANNEAFQREHPSKPRTETRKPFKRPSTGTKFTPKPQRTPDNPPRWKRPEAGRAK